MSQQAPGIRLEAADRHGAAAASCRRRRRRSWPAPAVSVSPVWYGVVVPARQAYSHSASVGRRYGLPSFFESQAQKSTACCQVTNVTGSSSPLVMPNLPRSFLCSGSNCSYCALVTSVLPMKKGCVILTVCAGASSASRSSHSLRVVGAFSPTPMVNSPAGMRTSFMPRELVIALSSGRSAAVRAMQAIAARIMKTRVMLVSGCAANVGLRRRVYHGSGGSGPVKRRELPSPAVIRPSNK